MYAIVEVGGQQFKVEKDKLLLVPKLEGEAGSQVEIKNVLLTSEEKEVKVGSPTIEGAKVLATIVAAERGKKVIVFKKKRKKGYQVKKGHKQDFTRIKIDDIVLK